MKKKLIFVLMLVVIAFFGSVSFYKFRKYKDEINEHYFVSSEIKTPKMDDDTFVDDKSVYKDNIITEDLKLIEYSYLCEGESITGTVYIGNDHKLYITDSNLNRTFTVSTTKFKTLYVKDYEYDNGIYLYALSYSNEIYFMSLETNDISDVNIYNLRWNVKFTNFVEIDYPNDMYINGNTIFALTEEGNIIDVNSGLRYSDKTKSLFNSIFVFEDSTMTNVLGNLIVDSKGNKYKIKYIFGLIKDNEKILGNDAMLLIVTDDGKFIYIDVDKAYVYEFDMLVKDISFDVYYPYIDGNLSITFEDDYKMNFIARCNEYYCPNEFAE